MQERCAGAVKKLLQAAVASGLAPGFVALWGGPEGTSCVAVGMRGLGLGPTGPDVWYDLASLTKPLVTTTLFLLARRHGLALEDPLGRYLSELRGTPWQDVTMQQCLTHKAGFPAWWPLYAQGELSRHGYLRALGKVPAAYPPGEGVVYSCLGFLALGFVLERFWGLPLEGLFLREVATPLGLAPLLGFAPPLATPVAPGERKPLVERALCRNLGFAEDPPPPLVGRWSCNDGNARGLGGAAGNAGLFGTALGVFRLACEYLPGCGCLLSPEEKRLATTNHTPGGSQARGLGWQLAATPGASAGPALAVSSFGHTGFTGTSLWVDPEAGMVFVLLGNRLHPGGRIPDLHPLRRRFHALAVALAARGGNP